MDNREAVNWLINISADIGKTEHSDLWHYEQALTEIKDMLESAQPEERTEKRTETHARDCISRKDAIRWIKTECNPYGKPTLDFESGKRVMKHLEQMPPAQPERTCVNCGRTANNGGWYADGGTRCPIEEHYALPKDGYCHLWEKRNITDDDYPERRTDG